MNLQKMVLVQIFRLTIGQIFYQIRTSILDAYLYKFSYYKLNKNTVLFYFKYDYTNLAGFG